MKKVFLALIIVVIIIFAIKLLSNEDSWICENGQWIRHGNPSAPMPTEFCPFKEGQIYDFKTCLEAGNPVMESYPRQCRDTEGNLYVEEISNELEKTNLIRVNVPRPNQTINSPLMIEGEARGIWFFEGDFPVKLLDQNDNVVAVGIASAQGEWMTEDFVPFTVMLEFNAPSDKKGKLVLIKDNPSGLPENDNQLVVPVIFSPVSTMIIKVYFNNDKLDPEFYCDKVFPTERKIAKTQAVARAALEELLKGPTTWEKEEGFLTNINNDVKIQKLVIENGIAKIDFNEQLEFQVGGSCRVAAIRSQITETLKQFSSVKEVIISINGRIEDILQP